MIDGRRGFLRKLLGGAVAAPFVAAAALKADEGPVEVWPPPDACSATGTPVILGDNTRGADPSFKGWYRWERPDTMTCNLGPVIYMEANCAQ